MSFLGPVGSLIPVKCASQLTSSGGRQVSFQDTLGKRKAFLGSVRARQWDVDIGLAKPAELSGLRWLAENVHSPMVWYSPDAVVGNVLPPDQADLAPGSYGGIEGPLVEVEPGVWVKSAFPDDQDFVQVQRTRGVPDYAPVPAGGVVTVSAWLRGNSLYGRQLVRVQWYDVSGGLVGQVDTDFSVSAGWVRRSVSLPAPPGAARVRLMPYAAQVAGPAITLTDRLLPYAPGKGATKVLAHGLSESLILVTQDRSISSASFTVTEVG